MAATGFTEIYYLLNVVAFVFVGVAGAFYGHTKSGKQAHKYGEEAYENARHLIEQQDRKIQDMTTEITNLKEEVRVVKTMNLDRLAEANAQLSVDYHKIADTLTMMATNVDTMSRLLEATLGTNGGRKAPRKLDVKP